MSLHHHAAGQCACDCCDWHGDASDLDQVENLEERLDPGGVVPAGQCPACAALAYLMRAEFMPREVQPCAS